MMRLIFVAALMALFCAPSAWSREAPINAEDPVVEARMMALASELRCLVCQNQTLAESDAALAEDFRREIRDLIREGKSDPEIIQFLVDRYGNFVRYRPPFSGATILLWLGPLLLVSIGAIVLVTTLRHRRKLVDAQGETLLSAADKKRLKALLKDDKK